MHNIPRVASPTVWNPDYEQSLVFLSPSSETRRHEMTSLLLRRFVFRMAEASAKRVTGDTPQGTMGRVQTAGEAPSRPLSPSHQYVQDSAPPCNGQFSGAQTQKFSG